MKPPLRRVPGWASRPAVSILTFLIACEQRAPHSHCAQPHKLCAPSWSQGVNKQVRLAFPLSCGVCGWLAPGNVSSSSEGRIPSEPACPWERGLGGLADRVLPLGLHETLRHCHLPLFFHLLSLGQQPAEVAPNQTGPAAREAGVSDGPRGWNSSGQGRVLIPLPRPGTNISWGWLVAKEGWPNN